MTVAHDTLALLAQLAPHGLAPRVKALHLPPPPSANGTRGEFCALELDDGAVGLSYVLLGDTWAQLVAQSDRYVATGDPALALAQRLDDADPIARTLALAAANAMTCSLFDHAGFVPPASADSLGHLDPQPGESVGMIGHFTPLIDRLLARGARLTVVELRADLVRRAGALQVTLDASALQGCTKVLATGTLLLNGTLEPMLAHCRGASRVALIGPSVGGPPDPLFARGITLLGGSWFTDRAAALDALRHGAPTSPWTRKFALVPESYPGWTLLCQRLG